MSATLVFLAFFASLLWGVFVAYASGADRRDGAAIVALCAVVSAATLLLFQVQA